MKKSIIGLKSVLVSGVTVFVLGATVCSIKSAKATEEAKDQISFADINTVFTPDQIGAIDGPKSSLVIDGISKDSELTGDGLYFRFAATSTCDVTLESDGFFLNPDNEIIKIKDYWEFDQKACEFFITGSKMRNLTSRLHSGRLLLALDFIRKGRGSTLSYNLFVLKK